MENNHKFKKLKNEFPEQLNPNYKLNVFLILSIVLISVNLRSHVAAIGPLLPIISDYFNISSSNASFILTIPLISFAILSPIVAKISNRIGIENTIFIGIVLMFVSSIARLFTGLAGLFVFTFVLGAGMAICNVAMPSLIKKDFPIHQAGIMTSIFTITFSFTGAIASGVSVPLSNLFSSGWKSSLFLWSITALIGSVFWLPHLKKRHKSTPSDNKSNILKSKKAWYISLFMASATSLMYIAMGWISEILLSRGLTTSDGGWAFSILQFGIMPATLISPIIASKMDEQKIILKVGVIPFLLGILGLMIPSSNLIFIFIVSALFGIGYGTTLGLTMVLFNLKAKTPSESASISGMAQCIAYMFSAIMPLIFGKLYDFTNNWSLTLVMALILLVFTFLLGLKSCEEGYI